MGPKPIDNDTAMGGTDPSAPQMVSRFCIRIKLSAWVSNSRMSKNPSGM